MTGPRQVWPGGSLCQVQVGNFFVFPESILIFWESLRFYLEAQPCCGYAPKEANSLPYPCQGQAP